MSSCVDEGSRVSEESVLLLESKADRLDGTMGELEMKLEQVLRLLERMNQRKS